MKKWIGISLGALVGISHISMIGMLANRSKLPVVNVPVGPYTSYQVSATEKGYTINYRANDPKVMHVERDIKRKGGFLGLGNNTTTVREQYTMDGSQHLENKPVGKSLSDKEVACLKAQGGENRLERLSEVASVPLLLLLVSPLFLMWVGCSLVLLLCSAWSKVEK